MSAPDSNGYFVELGEYSLILAKANLTQKPRIVDDLREVWLGDAAAVEAAVKEIKGEQKAKAVALLRLKNRAVLGSDAAIAKRVSTPAAVDDFLKEAVGADHVPANWAWVSQKDGKTPEGGNGWLLDSNAATTTQEALDKVTGWGFELLRVQSGPLASVGALVSAAKSAGAILLCDIAETKTFLAVVTAGGVTGFSSIAVGFDALAEATQAALGLKFRGSAARLMFNESYDFADAAAKIAEPLAVAVKAALPSLGGTAPASLVCTGILARQSWLSGALAAAVGLKPLTLDGGWAASAGLSLTGKAPTDVPPSWLGILGAISAYEPRNPGAANAWNPVFTNTPVAAAAVIPALVQEPPKPAVVITPPAPKPVEAPKPAEPAKPAAPAPKPPEAAKPAVVITPPAKSAEPPKPAAPVAKTPPPPAKPVEQKPAAKGPEPKAAAAPAKGPAKPEPAKPAPSVAKPTLAPAPAPAVKTPTATPFPKKKSPMPMIIGVIALLLLGGGGFFLYSSNQKEKERQAQERQELEQRAAAEASARRAAEEKAKAEAEARKKAEEEAAQRAVVAEKERTRAEEEARRRTAEQLLSARGNLVLNTEPSGATVVVGELAPRPSPLSMRDLRLGRYSVSVTLPGYDSEQREIEIKANETTDLGTIRLKRQVGAVEITSDPAGLDYELRPAGTLFVAPSDIRRGQTPASLDDVPVGTYQLVVSRPNWPNSVTTVTVEHNGSAKAHGTFVGGTVVINSTPPGAAVMKDGVQIGTTPLTLTDLQPEDVTYTLQQRGLEPATVSGRVEPGRTVTLTGTLLDIERVMRLSELDERPVPIQQVEPELSGGMRSDGGSATIEFVVNKDGTPSELKIVNASSPGFGRACLTAAAKWKFRPGTVRGKPVRTRMILPFRMGPES